MGMGMFGLPFKVPDVASSSKHKHDQIFEVFNFS